MYMSGAILSFIIALILDFKGEKAHGAHLNPYANTGNNMNDFFFGREIAPRIGFIDVRVLIRRVFIIGTVITFFLYYFALKNILN